jgi:hypothetical protein
VKNLLRLNFLERIAVGADEVVAYVDGPRWKAQDLSARMAQTILVYCANAPLDGRLLVTVRDAQGNALEYVRNGHIALPRHRE